MWGKLRALGHRKPSGPKKGGTRASLPEMTGSSALEPGTNCARDSEEPGDPARQRPPIGTVLQGAVNVIIILSFAGSLVYGGYAFVEGRLKKEIDLESEELRSSVSKLAEEASLNRRRLNELSGHVNEISEILAGYHNFHNSAGSDNWDLKIRLGIVLNKTCEAAGKTWVDSSRECKGAEARSAD